jgi:hypothetical protein
MATVSFCLACAGLYTVFTFSVERFSVFVAAMAVLNGVASGGEEAFSKKLSDKHSLLYLMALSTQGDSGPDTVDR